MLRKFLNVNGIRREVIVDGEERLINVLRDQLGLTGAKMACGNGQCGACSVIVDGKVKRGCIVKMKTLPDDIVIETPEGLGTPDNMSAVQRAFCKHGCTQCGFCIPGFVITATQLLRDNPSPTREDVREAFFKANNLCRCTGYKPMVDATMEAAAALRGETPMSSLDYPEPDDGRVWGSRRPRPNAAAKATGFAKYGADLGRELPPGTLRLALHLATVHHANIKSIDTSEAEKMPGVVYVITHKDIKGNNRIFGLPLYPWTKTDGFERPILCDEKVFQFGDAIAVVCADTVAHARAAADKVKVEYEELPAYRTAEEAVAPNAIEIHPGTPNIFFEQWMRKGGDATAIMEELPYVAEGEFFTQRQPHLLIEPDVGFTYMDDEGRLVIQSKSIALHFHVLMLSQGLGLKPEQIRIINNLMGGSFGYKLSPTMEAVCGAVTLATGRPAFLEYTGYQHMIYTGKRTPCTTRMRIGADKNGKFQALVHDLLMDHGAYSEFGDLLVCTGLRVALAGYMIPNIRGHGRTSYTNSIFSSAMRAYGAPQVQFVSEMLVDQLAAKMGMDPWELRFRNVMREGDTCTTGGKPDVYCCEGLLNMVKPKYEKLKAKCAERNANSADKKYGVGLALGMYNAGLENDQSHVNVELNPDGGVTVYSTWEDHGQGSDMGSLQTAHEALRPLGVPVDKIRLVMNDTALCPESGAAAASRSQVVTGNAHFNACEKLMDAMRKPDGSFRTYDEMIREGLPLVYEGHFSAAQWYSEADQENLQHDPVITYMYSVFMSEVEVDLATGKIKVLGMTLAGDVGKIGNYLIVEGQMYGGLAQGIGMALQEEFQDVEKHSTYRGAGFPTIMDIPDDMEVMLQETPRPLSAFGASGCGEMPAMCPHASILNAVFNATGALVTRLPARPERVLEALEAVKR